jgi:hypothetical protein
LNLAASHLRVIGSYALPGYFCHPKIATMKKNARQMLVSCLLGLCALIAIGSRQPHPHKCNAEWKTILNTNIVKAASTEFKESDTGSNIEINYPGFLHLLIQ